MPTHLLSISRIDFFLDYRFSLPGSTVHRVVAALNLGLLPSPFRAYNDLTNVPINLSEWLARFRTQFPPLPPPPQAPPPGWGVNRIEDAYTHCAEVADSI